MAHPAAARRAEAAMASSTRRARYDGGRTLVNQFIVPWHLATNMASRYLVGSLGALSALHAVLVPENGLLESTAWNKWGRAWRPRTRT